MSFDGPGNRLAYDGTLHSLFRLYESHPDSSLRKVKPGTRESYDFYLARLEHAYGRRRIDTLNGLDLKRWHEERAGEAWGCGAGVDGAQGGGVLWGDVRVQRLPAVSTDDAIASAAVDTAA
jgi:hypothetical protein